MVSGVHRAMAADGDFPARLAQMQRDGRVSGLHSLLVSRGGKVLFEHYGAGDDESWGKPLGTVRLDNAASIVEATSCALRSARRRSVLVRIN